MHTIVLATSNRHKIEELQQILCDYPFRWNSLEDFPSVTAPEEDGSTYLENALIKARAACRLTELPCLGDDSGLEVDSLQGSPGLHSARYAGPGSTQSQKIALLLSQLKGLGTQERQARFRCVIALVHPDGREWWSEGTCPGAIAESPRGEQGFGYDPIFWLPQYRKSMAELTGQTKNRISHRALATYGIMEQLYNNLPQYPNL